MLTEDEEAELKEFITGQNSDGLGEGAEQQDIKIPDGIMNVHFWNSGDILLVSFEKHASSIRAPDLQSQSLYIFDAGQNHIATAADHAR